MDETFFKGVFKLPPAHYMLIQNGQKQIVQYWDKNSMQKKHQSKNILKKFVQLLKNL